MLNIKEKLLSLFDGGDILFIVPPFTTNCPVIGPHCLQASVREKGFKADILYLNLLLASVIGFELSEKIGTSDLFQYWGMVNERLFCRSAYGLPPLGLNPQACTDETLSVSGSTQQHRRVDYDTAEPLDINRYLELEKTCFSFVEEVSQIIAHLDYKIIGCTARMGQTNCSVALIDRIKKIRPQIITMMGGANCQGQMAKGIASLSPNIDYIFSGESENSLCEFLTSFKSGELPGKRIINGTLTADLDSLPFKDYSDYFRQLEAFSENDAPAQNYVWSETSRGCWWGQNKKCTFCSRDNESLKFRAKSPKRVLAELDHIKKNYPGIPVAMADNIMPYTYYKDLLPILGEKTDYPAICLYYMKANLKLQDLLNLKEARVQKIVPGIESLSTGQLALINKGVTAADNLLLLRNARCVGINLLWFMLWGIPGDQTQDYRQLLKLLPLISHFQPPAKFFRVQLERFSNYFSDPSAYHIENLRPWAVYNMIYPDTANIADTAFGFTGDYPCGAYDEPDLMEAIVTQLNFWRDTWQNTRLVMFPFAGYYTIQDNRKLPGTQATHVLPQDRAKEIMTPARYTETEGQSWALQQKLAVVRDSRYVPLIMAEPKLLLDFQS